MGPTDDLVIGFFNHTGLCRIHVNLTPAGPSPNFFFFFGFLGEQKKSLIYWKVIFFFKFHALTNKAHTCNPPTFVCMIEISTLGYTIHISIFDCVAATFASRLLHRPPPNLSVLTRRPPLSRLLLSSFSLSL